MTMNAPADLLHRLESGYSLPALSPVALKLVELASDDTCSANDLVTLIEKDPALSVRLLKLANSAFFRSALPVTTLNQAVVKVGLRRLRIMALSISLRDTFPMGKVGPLNYEKFWRISLYRGLIAKSVAERLKCASQEEAFIAALIMEIGLLIFFELFVKGKNEAVSLEFEPLDDLLAWEKQTYEVNHREVGEAALRFWKFPEEIVACQRRTSMDKAPALNRLCSLARAFSGVLFHDAGQFQNFFQKAEQAFGLDHEIANEILMTAFDQVMDIADSLSVEINKEKDLLGVMEKANQALSQISEKITDCQKRPEAGELPSFDTLDGEQDIIGHTLQAVAHEIRNPLLAVGGFARKLASSIDPDSKGGKYAKIILEETTRLEAALSEMTQTEHAHL